MLTNCGDAAPLSVVANKECGKNGRREYFIIDAWMPLELHIVMPLSATADLSGTLPRLDMFYMRNLNFACRCLWSEFSLVNFIG